VDIELDDPFDDTNIRFVCRIQETEVREALKKTKENKVMGLASESSSNSGFVLDVVTLLSALFLPP